MQLSAALSSRCPGPCELVEGRKPCIASGWGTVLGKTRSSLEGWDFKPHSKLQEGERQQGGVDSHGPAGDPAVKLLQKAGKVGCHSVALGSVLSIPQNKSTTQTEVHLISAGRTS